MKSKDLGKILLGTTIETDTPEIIAYKREISIPKFEKNKTKFVKAIILKGTEYIDEDSIKYKTTKLFYLGE